MIALTERRCGAESLAGELERMGGRLMMLFVTPTSDGSRELCAIVRADGRSSVCGRASPAIRIQLSRPGFRRRTGLNARSTTCGVSCRRGTLASSR